LTNFPFIKEENNEYFDVKKILIIILINLKFKNCFHFFKKDNSHIINLQICQLFSHYLLAIKKENLFKIFEYAIATTNLHDRSKIISSNELIYILKLCGSIFDLFKNTGILMFL
jgi:hypothetical protein